MSRCPLCGFWWEYRRRNSIYGVDADVCIARFRRFPLDEVEAPLDAVVDHLLNSPDGIIDIHPRKFEEFVQGMLREMLDCSVELTQYAKDGGIDIMFIGTNMDKLLVEVKRYSPTRRIDVSIVRQLAGVLVRENVSYGMIVSTSNLTRDAVNEISTFSSSTQTYPVFIDTRSMQDILAYLDLLRDRSDFQILNRLQIGKTIEYMRACESLRIGKALGDHGSRIMQYITNGNAQTH